MAISEGQSDRAAELAEKMGVRRDDFDEMQFRRRIAELVTQQTSKNLHDLQIGRVVIEVKLIAADCHLDVPSELTLLGKTLLNLDLVGRTLDPEFDPNESMRRNAAKIMHDRTMKSFTPASLFGTLMEGKEFLEKLPSRLNQVLDLASTNKLRLKVETFNETLLVTTFQKIANRITLGLILAALIVGASLLMRVDTPFRILGYPGIAMICFFLASAGAVALAIQILRSDRTQNGK